MWMRKRGVLLRREVVVVAVILGATIALLVLRFMYFASGTVIAE